MPRVLHCTCRPRHRLRVRRASRGRRRSPRTVLPRTPGQRGVPHRAHRARSRLQRAAARCRRVRTRRPSAGTAGGVLVVPPSAPGTPLPLVIVFHPAGGSGFGVRTSSRWRGRRTEGPSSSTPMRSSARGTWAHLDRRPPRRCPAPLDVRHLLHRPRAHLHRGLSAGAVFTLFLGCNEPETFASLAAVAGTEDRFDTRCCKQPISALLIHGTDDEAISAGDGHNAADELGRRDGCGLHHAPAGRLRRLRVPRTVRGRFCPWLGNHAAPPWGGPGHLESSSPGLRRPPPRPARPRVATRSGSGARPAPGRGALACSPARRRPASRPRSGRRRARRPSPPDPPPGRTGPACTRPRPSGRRWAGPRPVPSAPGGAGPAGRPPP